MTNNSINAAQQAIATILGTVTEIQQVATGRTTDVSGGFPFCRAYFAGMGGDWEDQQSFYASYTFHIDIYQEISAKTKAAAEADLQGCVYAAMRALVTGWSLSGAADDSRIEASPAEEVETPQGPAVMMRITFRVRSLIY